MKTKPYPQIEEKPLALEEPAVAYGSATQSCASLYQPTPYEMEVLRRSEENSMAGRTYTQEEVDKMVEEWCRPFTMEELNHWLDEVEANDEADDLLTGEEVFAEMERKYPWLCK